MEFSWQHTAGHEALYVEQEKKQIWGYITWAPDSRNKIAATYCGPSAGGAPTSNEALGLFFDEKIAKGKVEERAAEVAEDLARIVPDQGAPSKSEVKSISDGLTGGLDKGVVKKS